MADVLGNIALNILIIDRRESGPTRALRYLLERPDEVNAAIIEFLDKN
jgi:hypothetical protein